jgi:hypothetical protein
MGPDGAELAADGGTAADALVAAACALAAVETGALRRGCAIAHNEAVLTDAPTATSATTERKSQSVRRGAPRGALSELRAMPEALF